MISRVKGRLRQKKDNGILLEIGDITYDIICPLAVLAAISGNDAEEVIELVTYHYYQVDQSKSVPVMIGFTNEIEKEFFEKFITVSGIGPKAAAKALVMPFSTIAAGIDRGDMAMLKKLPGIGEQKAREIIAKLQGKIGKFGLIQDAGMPAPIKVKEDIREEALLVLCQLQYKRKEAEEMIDKAVSRNPGIRTSEELINEIYRQRAEGKA